MTSFLKGYFLSLLFILSGAWLSYSAVFDSRDGGRRAAELQHNIITHQKQNALTALEIDELRVLVGEIKNDPAHMEELARRRLQMIKPGEIFVLPSDE